MLTAGSVDDGKSTLIGRLLYDSRALWVDQVQGLRARAGGHAATGALTMVDADPGFDLSMLTDGLEAEREQGITIDVAWRYFATAQRKFVLADTPGHEQYTRNMVSAAAGADAAVVLVDATKLDFSTASPATPALLPQTRRHALLAHLLRVPHIVFAVNKLDAVTDAAAAFAAVSMALRGFAQRAGFVPAGIIPMSALRGANVVRRSPGFAGVDSPALLELLHTLPTGPANRVGDASGPQHQAVALPVQYVSRQGQGSFAERVLWGRIAQGRLRVGDEVRVAGHRAKVASLRHHARATETAQAGESVGVVLDRDLDVSRGDWLLDPTGPQAHSQFVATAAWLDDHPLVPGRRLLLRHGHRWVPGRVSAIEARVDIEQLHEVPAQSLAVNQIGRVRVQLAEALPLQAYASSRLLGALLAVDPQTHRTGGALLVNEMSGPSGSQGT
jgi:sulfate adenylyltransferase subunit 1